MFLTCRICCCIEAHFLVALIGHGVNRSNSKIVSMSGLTRRFLNRRAMPRLQKDRRFLARTVFAHGPGWATKAVAAVFHEVGKPFELREAGFHHSVFQTHRDMKKHHLVTSLLISLLTSA